MCKAPKPPPQKEPEKPEFLRNPFLDAAVGGSGAVNQLRTGRSQLRIDIGSDIGSGLGIRQPGEALTQPNSRPTPSRPGTPVPRPIGVNSDRRLRPGELHR